MKDVFGNELNIGDDVVFVYGKNRDASIARGKVSKIYKGSYGDECSVGSATHIRRFRIAKISAL